MPRILPSQAVKSIEQLFPESVKPQGRNIEVSGMPNITFKFQAVLDLVDQIPPELITLTDEDYVIFSASVSALQWGLNHPRQGTRGLEVLLFPIIEFGKTNPIALIFDMLGKCPDEFPSANTSELTFIGDVDFRHSLRNDLSAISRALAIANGKRQRFLLGLCWKHFYFGSSIRSDLRQWQPATLRRRNFHRLWSSGICPTILKQLWS